MNYPTIVTGHAFKRYRERIRQGVSYEQIAAEVVAATLCPSKYVKCIGTGDDFDYPDGGEREIVLYRPSGAIFVTAVHLDRVVVVTVIALSMAEWTYSRHGRKFHKLRKHASGARKGK